jgi:predicted ArsR family transcriptional regulator
MTTSPNDIATVALLQEPVRRALYEAVITARRPVGRDEAASMAGVTRALAAFHLDKLAAAGLLDTEYQRLTGRSGPGAGRPSKLYRRGSVEVELSLPQRRYEVPAAILATAMQHMTGPRPPEALRSAAHDLGEGIGAAARQRSGARPGRRRLRTELIRTLEGRGYEPIETPSGEIRFANCPFHALVVDHRDLVCGMNLALATGILDGLRDERLSARLDPQPGQCCVAIAGGTARSDADRCC